MQSLAMVDAIGFVAGALTLATFAQTSMLAMRLSAIAANLCFISYGILGGFLPIVVLHTLLLPINLARLRQLRRDAAHPSSEHASPQVSTDGTPTLVWKGDVRPLRAEP